MTNPLIGYVWELVQPVNVKTTHYHPVGAGHNLPEPAPPFLAVWLTILVDNTFHLTINHMALAL